MSERFRKTQSIRLISEALDHTDNLFAIYDRNHNLVFANAAAFDAMPAFFTSLSEGATHNEATQQQIRFSLPDLPEEQLNEVAKRFIEKQLNGESFHVRSSKNRVFHVKHERLTDGYLLGIGMNITQITQQTDKMEALAAENFKLANTDQLTNLANRRRFVEVLEQKIDASETTPTTFYVGLLDLNGFKRINDIYGHAIGDALLVETAMRAKDLLKDLGFLARLGGDEFAIITQKPFTEESLMALGEDLCERLKRPQNHFGNNISVSASLGWAAFPEDGKTTSDLLRKSDYALYKSKTKDLGKTTIFSASDGEIMRRQSEICVQLETADLQSELYMEFQPIHDSKTGEIVAFEALARWQSPSLGQIGPDEFIPLAEKVGRVSDLTKVLLGKALETATLWPKHIDLHFNLSAIDLGKIDLVRDLIKIIDAAGYSHKSVVFEVTETAVIETFDSMSEIFDLFEENGLRLALDDFGIGFSSLSHLTRIPAFCLKIDKSFTSRLTRNSDEEKILKTIKYLCENLGIHCIVEGVENKAQIDQLSDLGLSHLQGHFFSKSIASDQLSSYILKSALPTFSSRSAHKIEDKRSA